MLYYIITELERQNRSYESMEDAIEAAERTLPSTMNWEIREEDGVGSEEVVYTHYID